MYLNDFFQTLLKADDNFSRIYFFEEEAMRFAPLSLIDSFKIPVI